MAQIHILNVEGHVQVYGIIRDSSRLQFIKLIVIVHPFLTTK